MAYIYENPFYREVKPFVKSEIAARATALGTKIRSAGELVYKKLMWSNSKIAYATVSAGGITIGLPGSNVMSDETGHLLMYSAARNTPKNPMLMSVDTSTEGTLGSLVTGKFTFTFFPMLSDGGWRFNNIEHIFFVPGTEVTIKFGWSVSAGSKEANKVEFVGIVYNFDWAFNADLSITANVSVVAKAAGALGTSADQVTPDPDNPPPPDPKGLAIVGNNLANVIKQDLTGPDISPTPAANGVPTPPANPPAAGDIMYYEKGKTVNKMLDYFSICLPFQDSASPQDQAILAQQQAAASGTATGTGAGTGVKTGTSVGTGVKTGTSTGTGVKTGTGTGVQVTKAAVNVTAGSSGTSGVSVVNKVFYYVKLGAIAEFCNELIDKFKSSASGASVALDSLYHIQCYNNPIDLETVRPALRSSNPINVFFPDPVLGEYGTLIPFSKYPDTFYQQSSKAGFSLIHPGKCANIGNILIGTDIVINTYTKFIEQNSTNIAFKNITSFFEEIVKEINANSGDMYNLTSIMRPQDDNVKNNRAILSIEDKNVPVCYGQGVKPLFFHASIHTPVMKSVSVSSKVPGPMAASVYVEKHGIDRGKTAGANGAPDKMGKPKSSPNSDTQNAETGATSLLKEADNALQEQKKRIGPETGFNSAWSEAFRGNLLKYKRNASGQKSWQNLQIYPVEWTLTLDGINGFRFGDIINTSLLPAGYIDVGKMVFMITKISHSVKDGSWETTINTQARISY